MLYETFVWLLIILLGLVIVFYCVCLLCDEHLVPCIEVIIEQFKIPEEVAAVTFVAFGSACPEIVLNSIGALENKSSLSLPACLGSGIIAFGLIPPLCVLVNWKTSMKLKSWPIIREASFYCIALLLFLSAFSDGVVSVYEALLLVTVYIVYVGLVLSQYLLGTSTSSNNINSHSTSTTSHLSNHAVYEEEDGMMPSIEEGEVSPLVSMPLDGDSLDMEPVPTGVWKLVLTVHKNFYNAIGMPIQSGLELMMPALRPSGGCNCTRLYLFRSNSYGSVGSSSKAAMEESTPLVSSSSPTHAAHTPAAVILEPVSILRVVLVLASCIVYIGVFASCIIILCTEVTTILDMNNGTVGATMIALGSEIPDTISSIALSKNQYNEAAMAGAIGSQVINLSLGVGMPLVFLCMNSAHYEYVLSAESSHSLMLLTSILFVIISTHILCILPMVSIKNYLLYRYASGSPGNTNPNNPNPTLQALYKEVQQAELTRTSATCLIIVWFLAFVTFIVQNEQQ